MTRKWTDAQKAAINTRGRTLLVSAAAGSGKTATLTERIIRRLTDPTDPLELSRLLIVTFTRAATTELRERIGGALSDAIAADPTNRHLRRQLLNLGNASISTIDSFMRAPVKAHFAELGLPVKTRIADQAELTPLSERVMGELMEEFYTKYATRADGALFSVLSNNPFADLCDSLTPSKNDEALLPTLRKLYDNLLSFPDGIERLRMEAEDLERGANGDFFNTAHGALLREWLGVFCTSAEKILSDGLAVIEADERANAPYGPSFVYDLDFVRKLQTVNTYSDAYDLINSYEKINLKSLKDPSPEVLEKREARKKVYTDLLNLKKDYFAENAETLSDQMRKTALMCRVLYDFLTKYDVRMQAEKLARNMLCI